MFDSFVMFIVNFVAIIPSYYNSKISMFIMNIIILILSTLVCGIILKRLRKRRRIVGHGISWPIQDQVDTSISNALSVILKNGTTSRPYVKFVGGAGDDGPGKNNNGDIDGNDKDGKDSTDVPNTTNDGVTGDTPADPPANNDGPQEPPANNKEDNVKKDKDKDSKVTPVSNIGKGSPSKPSDDKHRVVKIDIGKGRNANNNEAYGNMYIKNRISSIKYTANEIIETFDPFGAVDEIVPAYEITPTAFKRRKIVPSQMFEFMYHIVDRLAPQSIMNLTRHDFVPVRGDNITSVEWKIQQQLVINNDDRSRVKDSFIFESDAFDLFFRIGKKKHHDGLLAFKRYTRGK